jgi:hypothetical protein
MRPRNTSGPASGVQTALYATGNDGLITLTVRFFLWLWN